MHIDQTSTRPSEVWVSLRCTCLGGVVTFSVAWCASLSLSFSHEAYFCGVCCHALLPASIETFTSFRCAASTHDININSSSSTSVGEAADAEVSTMSEAAEIRSTTTTFRSTTSFNGSSSCRRGRVGGMICTGWICNPSLIFFEKFLIHLLFEPAAKNRQQ